MSNFTLEKPPFIPDIPDMDVANFTVLAASAGSTYVERFASPELRQPFQSERSRRIGVLARRAAISDFYGLTIENRRSAAATTLDLMPQPANVNDAVIVETVADGNSQRNRWNNAAVELIGLCPELYSEYHTEYRDYFSHLNNPSI